MSAAKRTLEAEYQKIGDAQTVLLIEEKRKVEETVAYKQQRVRELDKNIDGHRQAEDEIQNRLRNLQAVRQIQERREGLQADKAARSASLSQVRSEVSALLSSRAYTIFLPDACNTYRRVVDAMRQRGELPAGIKKQFVEDLLSKAGASAGTVSTTTERLMLEQIVESWKNRAGLADVEEKAIRMGGEVKQLEVYTDQFWVQLDHFEERRTADRQELSRIEENLERISEQLRHSGEEEVGPLEERRRQILKAIEGDLIEQGSCREGNEGHQERLREIEAALEKHQATEAKQQLAKRRLDAARDVIERIEKSKSRFEAKFRVRLNEKSSGRCFDKISYTPYVPEITEEYSLCLREAAGVCHSLSQLLKASQILSLCFIGAVIELAESIKRARSVCLDQIAASTRSSWIRRLAA